MSYCRNCGAYVPDWAENCPACDMPVKGKAQPKKDKKQKDGQSAGAQTAREEAGRQSRENAGGRGDGGTYTYDGGRRRKYAESYDQDTRENQTMGYLCYLGPLLLVPLLARPKSRFLRYHCNQGLLLFIFAVLVSIFDGLTGIGWLIGLAGGIATIVWLVQGFTNVSRGLRRPLSFIGEITILK